MILVEGLTGLNDLAPDLKDKDGEYTITNNYGNGMVFRGQAGKRNKDVCLWLRSMNDGDEWRMGGCYLVATMSDYYGEIKATDNSDLTSPPETAQWVYNAGAKQHRTPKITMQIIGKDTTNEESRSRSMLNNV